MDGMGQQLRGFTQTTQTTLEGLRGAVDERLAQAVAESRNGRSELLAAFTGFEGRLEQRFTAFDAALTQRQAAQDAALAQRFDALQLAVASRLEESSKALLAYLAQGQADAAAARKELSGHAHRLPRRADHYHGGAGGGKRQVPRGHGREHRAV